MRFPAVLAVLLTGVTHAGWCIAAEPEDMPAIEVPASLKPYSDVAQVIDAAESAIKQLGTAKFDEPLDNVFTITKMLANPPCDAPDITSFYRGMTLVKAGYYVFINKIERGFESLDSPHLALPEGAAVLPTTFGALVKPGREVLVGVWGQDKRKRLLSLTSAVRQLPPDIKADLAGYFGMLREFAQRYDALKRRAPGDLTKLNERATLLYSYKRLSALETAKSIDQFALSHAKVRYPEAVSLDRYAKEMRLLLNANRDVGQRNVSECFDGGGFAQFRLGSNGEACFWLSSFALSHVLYDWFLATSRF